MRDIYWYLKAMSCLHSLPDITGFILSTEIFCHGDLQRNLEENMKQSTSVCLQKEHHRMLMVRWEVITQQLIAYKKLSAIKFSAAQRLCVSWHRWETVTWTLAFTVDSQWVSPSNLLGLAGWQPACVSAEAAVSPTIWSLKVFYIEAANLFNRRSMLQILSECKKVQSKASVTHYY